MLSFVQGFRFSYHVTFFLLGKENNVYRTLLVFFHYCDEIYVT